MIIKQDIIIQEVGNETIAYDPETHATHLLNATVSAVFKAITGNLDSRTLFPNLDSESAEELLESSLSQLKEKGLLLEETEGKVASRAGRSMTRRDFARNAAAAVALPLITTVIAAEPAAAQSGCPTDTYVFTPTAALPEVLSGTNTAEAVTTVDVCATVGDSSVVATFTTNGTCPTGLDDALAFTDSTGATNLGVVTGFALGNYDPATDICDGIPSSGWMRQIGSGTVNLTSLFAFPLTDRQVETVRLVHCNVASPRSCAPEVTITVS